jgi:hypothetical protein
VGELGDLIGPGLPARQNLALAAHTWNGPRRLKGPARSFEGGAEIRARRALILRKRNGPFLSSPFFLPRRLLPLFGDHP